MADASAGPGEGKIAEFIENNEVERVAVDTTLQPKAVAHPTDAKLIHNAIDWPALPGC